MKAAVAGYSESNLGPLHGPRQGPPASPQRADCRGDEGWWRQRGAGRPLRDPNVTFSPRDTPLAPPTTGEMKESVLEWCTDAHRFAQRWEDVLVQKNGCQWSISALDERGRSFNREGPCARQLAERLAGMSAGEMRRFGLRTAAAAERQAGSAAGRQDQREERPPRAGHRPAQHDDSVYLMHDAGGFGSDYDRGRRHARPKDSLVGVGCLDGARAP
ncbi:unnamed protein product [Prorocentrum cordatum]|uniref:Uncharacterized protein n=1 Tax=Prorocentrum cordatum TaxID=2364126 RepID=A0ABN9PXX2_9DINO|nr:unnamed protein product [Polarella glacialis]